MQKSNSTSSESTSRLDRKAVVWLAVILFVVVIPLGLYMTREPLLNGMTTTRSGILSAVGLGAIPVAALIGALLIALIVNPGWLRRYNVWLSAAMLTLALAGALSFFRPLDGPLGWFSIYGRTTLGGALGEAVIGSQNVMGALRLFAIFLIAVAVALPVLTGNLGRLLGQGLIFVYLSLFMAIRSLTSRRPPPDVDDFDFPEAVPNRASEQGWMDDLGPREDGSPYRSFALSPVASSPVASSIETAEEQTAAASEHEAHPDEEKDSGYPAESAVASLEDDEDDEDDIYPPFEQNQKPVIVRLPDGVDERHFHPDPGPYWQPKLDPQPEEPAPQAEPEPEPAFVSSSPAPIPMRAAPPPAPSPTAAAAFSAPRSNGTALMWQRPSIDLMKQGQDNQISDTELHTTGETITQTLGEYGVEVQVGHVRPGPTVTMYGLVPGYVRRNKLVRQVDDDGNPIRDESGKQITKRVEQKTRVKVDSILAREKDLALALKTPSLRIETPAMGRSLVGIEVPNPNPSLVTLRSVMESGDFQKQRARAHLPVALGRGSGGESISFDLAKMPHLLVAGATGSGKSVCLNAIVSCLITEKTPAELRLLLIDPKRVELTPYNGIPHLMAPVIVETDTVVGYLKGLIREMFERYRRMEEVGVRNIEAYNNKMPDKMPFLCVVVDELADLMMTAAFDVEQSLCRLAQLGRATGIHLIIATQRPSVDVVTGLIKANFPSRISFGVTSQVDSRTILDTSGADKLLGRGDMLYLPLDASKPARVQNVFIGDDEIEDLVAFWKNTPWAPLHQIDLLGGEEIEDAQDAAQEAQDPDRDDMMDKAIELALNHRKLSTSLLQRRLRIGYPRAARLMDQLEEEGVVGPGEGSKSRDVIINQN